MTYRVPFVNPREHYRRLKAEIDPAITETLAAGDLVMRRQLREFEARLAEYVGARYAVGVNSGYDALHMSLVACGVGPGHEVITVAHTFVATVSAIIHCGATPVLVDVAADFNLDVSKLEAAITPRTKAIIPVHLNGRVCQMDRLMEIAEKHRLFVVEDAAQALGARFAKQMAGSFGKAGCFSFYPFKALGGIGDGGAVTTNDPAIARQVTLLRFNGEDRETGGYQCHGYTALLDNVQAAVLDVKLRHLPEWIEHRRKIARRYESGLSHFPKVILPPFDGDRFFDSFQNYVIRTPQRDRLRAYLTNNGVETLVHWPKPMWAHPNLGIPNPGLTETERICDEVISLPMSGETTEDQVDYVCSQVGRFYDS